MRLFISVCTFCQDKIHLQKKIYNMLLENLVCNPSMDHFELIALALHCKRVLHELKVKTNTGEAFCFPL